MTDLSPDSPANAALYLYDRLRAEATRLLAQTGLVEAADVTLATPKPNIPADLAFPVFPVFAARNKAGQNIGGAKNPNEFAKQIAEAVRLDPGGLLSRVESAGGFVNFAADATLLAREAVQETLARGEAFGHDTNVGAGKTVIVEYSSPNIAKKLHMGSLRTTVIGHSLYLILKALGYNAVGDNHLGDWGTQFGFILLGLEQEGTAVFDASDPVEALMTLYQKYNDLAADVVDKDTKVVLKQGDPVIRAGAQAWFKKLEDGDAWARATWKRVVDISLAEFDQLYARLNITFDTQIGESFFEPVLNAVVQEALDKGVAHVEPGGAVVVEFGEGGLPSCLLRKTDGATLYQTRDAATCIYRWKTYHPARNIYVVGDAQKLHFQQVFEIVRRMGYTEIADRSVHIPFGLVTDVAGRKFSTRKGNLVFADGVLDAAAEQAQDTIREKIAEGKTELPPAEVPVVAELVGKASVIYADLYQGPERKIKFDLDTIIAFEGNTALYLQYTYARCRSILRKAGDDAETATLATADCSVLIDPKEQAVVKQLHRFPFVVRDAGEKFSPALVAEWSYTLAREYARFYDELPVLTAPTPELRAARLALTAAVAQGLKNGLALLGIEAPERM